MGKKYRNKVLTEQIKKDLKSLLYQIAEEKGFSIEHFEIGMDDMCICLCPSRQSCR
ncbi:MAG: transposase [Floccifex porci]|uniref:transposase n=1 Tax=Floccifex porci TaxID=2606629 RepID=UPI003F00F478